MPRGIYKRTQKKSAKAKAKKTLRRKDRKWLVDTVAEPFAVTEEVVADSLSPRDSEEEDIRRHIQRWYDEAPSPAERQARKAALTGIMYGAGPQTFPGTGERRKEIDAMLKDIRHEGIHHDPVSHPAHYVSHPSGVECITITEHFNFNRGNAIKYIWRADEKGSTLENLRKAQWYLNREIERLSYEATR